MSKLKRALGPVSLTLFGVGMMVGAGIYSVIGKAAAAAGDALWLSFLLGAIAAFLTGLSYAELATTFPEAGAEYVYVGEAFPRRAWLPFITGCIIILAGTATVATVALAFGGYLRLFLDVPVVVSAALLIICCALLNIAGIRESKWINAVLTSVEVGGLLLVIYAGSSSADFGAALSAPLEAGVLVGAALIFFVYLGFEDIANLSEESIRPSRDLPLAIILSMALTSVLYVLVALSVVALIDPQQLGSSESPLASAVAGRSPALSTALGWIALVATANTALIGMIVTSRMTFSMARSGDLPGSLALLLPRRSSPWVAALATLVLAALFLPLGRLEVVASVSSVCALLAFMMVNLALLVLRWRRPRLKRPFRVPLSIGKLPLLPLLALLAIAALLTQFEPLAYIIALGGLFLVLAMYFMLDKLRRRQPA
jgi:amino acid transporter